MEYELIKAKYQTLGEKEVKKAREAFEAQCKRYVLTKEGKAELKEQISNKLIENLDKYKKQFVTEARNSLMNEKALLLQQREQEKNSKSQQEQILELLQWQQDVALLQAKANTMPVEVLVDELNNITDPKLFDVFKGAILGKCNEEQAVQVRSAKFVDRELEQIESSIKDCNFIDFKQGYVLPMGMDDRSIADLVFGEDLSNIYFENNKEVGE